MIGQTLGPVAAIVDVQRRVLPIDAGIQIADDHARARDIEYRPDLIGANAGEVPFDGVGAGGPLCWTTQDGTGQLEVGRWISDQRRSSADIHRVG